MATDLGVQRAEQPRSLPTPTRAPSMALPAPAATGDDSSRPVEDKTPSHPTQLTLEELAACQFKPYAHPAVLGPRGETKKKVQMSIKMLCNHSEEKEITSDFKRVNDELAATDVVAGDDADPLQCQDCVCACTCV